MVLPNQLYLIVKLYNNRPELLPDTHDIETRKYSNWINILRDTSSVFNFTVKGEYQDEYRFAINSDKLNEALKDAGILHDIIE